MKFLAPPLVFFHRRWAVLALAFAFLFSGWSRLEAATLPVFQPIDPPRTIVDFTGLSDGESIESLGWSSSYVDLYTGAAARQPSSAPYSRVVQVGGTASSQNVNGPALTSPFAAHETAYLQTSMNRMLTISSGARITMRAGTSNVAGFGIVNSGTNPFAIWADGGWKTSSESALSGKWYDLRLVIDVNPTDITLSVGHLFVRNLTDGETEFRLIEDLSNINLGFTSDFNMSSVTSWRIENGRHGVQIGNLTGGVGTMAIPEPGTTALLGLAVALGCASGLRRYFRRASGNR